MAKKTIRQIFDSLNDDQKTIVYHLVGKALEAYKQKLKGE